MFVGAFGAITWDVFLLCALNYPQAPNEAKQLAMSQFIIGLVQVLPCDGCSVHATEYIRVHPPDVSSSNALVEYIISFHNSVNSKTGNRIYTTEEAKKSLFDRYFMDGVDMSRALQMRKEDHAKITELQKTIAEHCSNAKITELQETIVEQHERTVVEQHERAIVPIVIITMLAVLIVLSFIIIYVANKKRVG